MEGRKFSRKEEINRSNKPGSENKAFEKEHPAPPQSLLGFSQQYSQYPPPEENQYQGNVVLTQPLSVLKVESSTIIREPFTYGGETSIPYGLEYLAAVDQLNVLQRKDFCDAFRGCNETNHRYRFVDIQGQQVFYGKETTSYCARMWCCASMRSLEMKICHGDQEIIHLVRPFACGSCSCPCCLQSLQVESPPGNPIGSVDEIGTLVIPKYYVKDASGQKVFYIEGPCSTASWCRSHVEFVIYTADKATEVGTIIRKFSGTGRRRVPREFYREVDNFGIKFPRELDPRLKATLIGALMLIDFMFYEIVQ